MNLKNFFKKIIRFYQYFISPLFGSKCRYHPTCSEYAIWEFECDNLFKAFFKTILRILRCNQLFSGGIDYPIIKRDINPQYGKKLKIKYWLVPIKKNKFYVIKAYNE